MRSPLPTAARIQARLDIVELRSLIAADCFIAISRRNRLIQQAASLVQRSIERELFVVRLTALVTERFGRNPDNCEPSPQTLAALRLLDAVQQGQRW